MPCSDRATQIHQHSERALSSAEILFGAPLRAARRLSFPLAGKPHIKALLFHNFNRDNLRVPCLGSRKANTSAFGAGAIECRNLIWRTVACSATSQLSVSRKTAQQSFVISQLQSRRFACAMHRIAQRKSINIRSGAMECRNLIGATAACSATSQLSVSRKPHIKPL